MSRRIRTTPHPVKSYPRSRMARKGNSTFELPVTPVAQWVSGELPWRSLSQRHEATAPPTARPRAPEAESWAERNADSFPEVPSWEGNQELTTASWAQAGKNQALRRRTFDSSETMKVKAQRKKEKSTVVGRCPDRTSLGWPHMAPSKQWLSLNGSEP